MSWLQPVRGARTSVSAVTEGSLVLALDHPEMPDWAMNNAHVELAFLHHGETLIRIAKHPDRLLHVAFFSGQYAHTFRVPVPPLRAGKLHVALHWRHRKVTLALNGPRVRSATARRLRPI